MCNAWNHPAGCNCGWGGGGSGGWRGGVRYNYNLSQIGSRPVSYLKPLESYQVPFSVGVSSAETYPTNCWWCGATVYYHTNGYGDSVLFDSLGYPWQIHSCWSEYWSEEKERRRNPVQSPRLKPIVLEQSLQLYKLKYLLLVGAVQSLKKSGTTVTDKAVAEQLGITPKQLYHYYGRLYELYSTRSKG